MVKSVFDITIDFEKSHGSYVFDKKSHNNKSYNKKGSFLKKVRSLTSYFINPIENNI